MHERANRARSVASARALTLIEVLVVAGVVVVVLAITIPSLRSARGSTADATSLANLRSGAQMFATWSAERKDEHLNYQLDPVRYASRCGPGFHGIEACLRWEEQSVGNGWALSWLWTTGERPDVHSFVYAFTFLTDPSLWTDDVSSMAVEGISRFRPTFAREITYPAQKAMLLWPSAKQSQSILIGFADASARDIRFADIVPQFAGPFTQPNNPYNWPGFGTPDGIRGRDVTR